MNRNSTSINQYTPLVNYNYIDESVKSNRSCSKKKVLLVILLTLGLMLFATFGTTGMLLLRLRDIKIQSTEIIEVVDACNTSTSYRLKAILYNPCPIPVKIHQLQVDFLRSDYSPFASTFIPISSLPYGYSTIDFYSLLQVSNETSISQLVQQVFSQGQVETIHLKTTAYIHLFGIPAHGTVLQDLPVTILQSGTVSNWLYSYTNVYQQSNNLFLDFSWEYFHPIANFTLHAPRMHWGVWLNDTLLSPTISDASVFYPGFNNLSTFSVVGIEQVPTLSNLLKTMTNDKMFPVVNIKGSNALNQECMLQRIISKLDIAYNTSLLKRALDVSVNSVNVSNFQLENGFDIIVNYSLDTIKFNFDLDNVSMSLYSEDNNTIANVLTTMYANDIASMRVTVSNFEYLGNLLTMLTNGNTRSVYFKIQGDNVNSTDVLRLILSQFYWGFNYTVSNEEFLVRDTYLVGQSDNKYVASILVGATIAPSVNFAIFSTIPAVYIQVETPQGLIILINSMETQVSISSGDTFEVQVLATVINGTMALDAFVNKNNVDLFITGDYSQGQPNVFQEILKYWHLKLTTGTGTFGLELVNTTLDSVFVTASLVINNTFPFPFIFGNVNGSLSYNDNNAISVTVANGVTQISPGPNLISVNVVGIPDNKATIEQFVSSIFFGYITPFSVGITFNNTKISTQTTLIYDLIWLNSTLANTTRVFRCIDLNQLKIDYIDFFKLECQLEVDVDAWFYNPLPWEIEIETIDTQLYFPDPLGFGCTPFGCIYPPVASYYVGHVIEPSGYQPPMPYEAPFYLDDTSFNRTTLRIKTDSDELCIRLYNEYENNNLYFDLVNTLVGIKLENYVIHTFFNMTNIPFLKDGVPCSQNL